MAFIKYIVVITACLFLFACAGGHHVKKDYVYQPSSETGLVIGSITRKKSPRGYLGYAAEISSMSLRYQNQDKTETGYVVTQHDSVSEALFGFMKKKKRDFAGLKGSLFVLELPVGVYEFYEWTAIQGTYTNLSKKIEPPITFTVSSGQPIYIGEIDSEIIYGKNFLGIGLAAGVLISTKDSRKRDISVLKEKYENIPVDNILYQIANTQGSPPPELEREVDLTVPIILSQ